MRRSSRLHLGSAGLLAALVMGCTTTYTQAQLQAQESHDDAEARAVEDIDRAIGEEGGSNQETLEDQGEQVGGDDGTL